MDVSENIKIGSWNIGDKINIDFDKKDYLDKSIRRNIMDNIIEHCMHLPTSNLANMVKNMRFFFDGELDQRPELKLIKDFVKGKRHAMPKIIEEKRRWIRNISQLINNFQYAIITGIKVNPHHLSNICPSNISYMKKENHLLNYTVMLVGKISPSNVCEPSSNIFGNGSDGKMNIVAIEVDLLDDCFLKTM